MDGSINPRYANYCRSQGRTAAEQKAYDEVQWPGGRCCGFLLWMSYQKQAFLKAHPEHFAMFEVLADQDAWDRWLDAVPLGGYDPSVRDR